MNNLPFSNHSRRSARAPLLASAALWYAVVLGLVGAGGCTTLPWGGGGLGEEVPAEATDPHGLVRVLGEADLVAAAARLTHPLPPAWAEGVALVGEVTLTAGEAEVVAALEGLVVEPGPIQLALTPAGLEVRVGVALWAPEAGDPWAQAVACAPSAWAEAATLTFTVGLASDKLGRVQAALLGGAGLSGEGLGVDWGGCVGAELASWLEALEGELWGAVAEAAAEALAPEVLAALPAALGLDLATGAAGSVASDAVGAGFARLSVAAVAPDGGEVWRPHGAGSWVVPFGVGITAEAHPCMPALALPAVTTTPLPSRAAGAGGGLLVGAGVVRRAIAAAWVAGAACGTHASWGVEVGAADLAPAWPALARLPAGTAVSLAIWPREAPSVGLAIRGADRLTVATGLLDLDLFAEIDGATVRLASVTLGAEVEVAVKVDPSGLVTLAPEVVRLSASGAREGLFGAPPLAVAEAVLQPIALALFDGRPVLRLPSRPATSSVTRARVTAEHVAIPM